MNPDKDPTAKIDPLRLLGGRTDVLFVILFGALFAYSGCYRAMTSPPGDFANCYTASRLVLSGGLNAKDAYDYYNFQQQVNRYYRGTLASFIPLSAR